MASKTVTRSIHNSREKRSQNELVCENAALLAQGSCLLRVMGSWKCKEINRLERNVFVFDCLKIAKFRGFCGELDL